MQHCIVKNAQNRPIEYVCIVEKETELVMAAYESRQYCVDVTRYGSFNIPCYISYDGVTLQINSIPYPTQIYSKMLRALRIHRDGVSLSKLSYTDLI